MNTLIFVIVGLVIVLIVVKKLFSLFDFSKSLKRSYSWFEILYPFNSEPMNIYKRLSPDNKGAFWSIISSVVIGVLTCWLGFSVQYSVYESTQKETSKITHYQVVDKFKPIYSELYDSCSSVLWKEFYKAVDLGSSKKKLTAEDYVIIKNEETLSDDKNSGVVSLLYFFLNEKNWDDIICATEKCIEISSSIAPYVDAENSEKLITNNSFMLTGMQLIESLNDTIVLDSITFVNRYWNEYIDLCIKGCVPIRNNLNELLSSSYSSYCKLLEIQNSDVEKFVKKEPIVELLVTCLVTPFVTNTGIIRKEFEPKEEQNPWIQSLKILLISLIVGYILFRIVLMKFFDVKSMQPNPQISQSDLDKLNRELKYYRGKDNQNEININSQSLQIKELQKELDGLALDSKKCKEKNIELTNINISYEKEIDLLKQRIKDFESNAKFE